MNDLQTPHGRSGGTNKPQAIEDYLQLIGSFAQAIWETDASGKAVQDAPGWRSYTGQTLEQWLGEGWVSAIHPDDRCEALRQWRQAVQEQKPVNAEFRLKGPDGGWRWTNVRATAVRNPDGSICKWIGVNIDITEKKRAEEAGNQSEKKYRTLFDSIDEGFCTIEVLFDRNDQAIDYRFLEANPAFIRQTGLENAIGRTMLELAPDHEPFWIETYGCIVKTGKAMRFEHQAAALGRFYDVYAFPTGLPGQNRVAILFNDIFVRKQADEALRKSEENFRTLFESMQEGYTVCQAIRDESGRMTDYRFLQVNPAFEQLTGLKEDQTLGRTAREMLPGLNEKWFNIYQQVVDTHQTLKVEEYIPPLNEWYTITAFYYGEEQFAVLFDEITKRKRQERNLAFLAEASQDLAMLTNIDETMDSLGAKVCAYFNTSVCAFGEVDERYEIVTIAHESKRAGVPSLKGVHRINDYHTDDFRRSCRAGEVYVVRDAANDPRTKTEPMEALSIGSFVGVPLVRNGDWCFQFTLADPTPRDWRDDEIELMRELADRIWARLERARAEEALREADQRKDEFLSMLAHELRNPLATVRNGLTILKQSDEPDSETPQLVAVMDRQVTHLVRMIDDLLDVRRISRGKIELRPEQVELGALVTEAVEDIRPQFEQHQRILYFAPPKTDLLLHGDATRLTQVVTNLLTNGLRYTKEHGKVWVSVRKENNEAVLRIADNGIGLTDDQLTSIFELFAQADHALARSQGGLGIGLTLASQIVELHGGRIKANSKGLGQGSEFVVHLPLMEQAEKKKDKTEASAISPADQHAILVIDDNADAALTLSMILKKKGFEVHIRYDGLSGIEAAEAIRPVAILCDISMPQLDGYETARRIRNQAWGKDILLIALTGYGQEEDKQQAKQAGFNSFLTKPVDLNELINLLATVEADKEAGSKHQGNR